MALTTKGTWEIGVFAAGSLSHFDVQGIDLTVDANFEAFVKAVQTLGTFHEIGVRKSGADAANATRFSIENNGVTTAQLDAATGGTTAAFVY